MNRTTLLLLAALLSACATKTTPHHTEARTAPSVGQVKADVQSANDRVTHANGIATSTGNHLQSLRSRSQRIDDKATVLLENLP